MNDYNQFGVKSIVRREALTKAYEPFYEDLLQRLLKITKGKILWGSPGAELADLMDLEVNGQMYITDIYLDKQDDRMICKTTDGYTWKYTYIKNANPVWVRMN